MNICSLEECNRPVRARKLCASHYQKSIAKPYVPKDPSKKQHKLSNIVDGLATCIICGPETETYTRPSGQVRCRTVERRRAVTRPKYLGSRYYFGDGDSIPDSEATAARLRLYKEQRGLCAICKRDEATVGTLCLDHCHETGKIRGLLCRKCNTGLGMFHDNLENVLAASEYLTH